MPNTGVHSLGGAMDVCAVRTVVRGAASGACGSAVTVASAGAGGGGASAALLIPGEHCMANAPVAFSCCTDAANTTRGACVGDGECSGKGGPVRALRGAQRCSAWCALVVRVALYPMR